jgi:DNA-binding beta-propeller fold protein YncE
MNATRPWMRALVAVAAASSLAPANRTAQAAEPLLQIEAKIPLGDVRGRIDHMAVDLERHRLFVAELGNDSVAVVDIDARKVVHRIAGLKEPQGTGYVPSSDTLYVANAGDGSLRLFQAGAYEPTGQIDLGDDADNVRVDPVANRVFVGYGNGALAIIDPTTRSKIADVALKAHPEGFQLARSSANIFVNVPNRREIAVVDRATGKQTASWPLSKSANFPMALDDEGQHVVVAFRSPPALAAFSPRDGAQVTTVDVCGDADDVFLDSKRHRAYVSCGSGFLDVFDAQAGAYRRVAHILTASGARTALFVPELDRLLLAVRESAGERAAIWIFRPTP